MMARLRRTGLLAPSVLTVGGVNDKNRLAFSGYEMYHSSYGPTVDGLQKPEVIAPGIFIAAPLLPGTTLTDCTPAVGWSDADPEATAKTTSSTHRCRQELARRQDKAVPI